MESKFGMQCFLRTGSRYRADNRAAAVRDSVTTKLGWRPHSAAGA